MTDELRGPATLAGVAMPTWVLRYDAAGNCRSPLTRTDLLQHLRTGDYSDVIVFSHGWNNNFDAACGLYGSFLKVLEQLLKTTPCPRPFSPLFVGIAWPSTWLVFSDGPNIAGDSIAEDTAIAELASRLDATRSVQQGARFRTLMKQPTIDLTQAKDLAELLAPLIASDPDDEIGAAPVAADDLLLAAQSTASAERGSAGSQNLDDFGGTGGSAADPQAAGLLSALDPRTYIRLASVYQMKDRAGRVGAQGMSPLLRDIQASTRAKVHVAGHSYGCKVVLSGICVGPNVIRPIDSLLLLQPAVSHLCFAERVPGTNQPGGYRRALDPAVVRGPIMSTYSRSDFPLHATFHLALRRRADLGEVRIAGGGTSAGDPPSRYAALGGYGPRGAGEMLLDPIHAAGAPYRNGFGASILGLDGSNGGITGHGDVTKPETAWALLQLIVRS